MDYDDQQLQKTNNSKEKIKRIYHVHGLMSKDRWAGNTRIVITAVLFVKSMVLLQSALRTRTSVGFLFYYNTSFRYKMSFFTTTTTSITSTGI
jgi:hypothetical protein